MAFGTPFQLIDVLLSHNVPFVVIGGYAVTFHGFVRATEDIDIVFLRTKDSEYTLLAALREVNAKWIGDEIDSATGLERTYPVSMDFIRANRLMMLLTDCGYLDVFDFIPGFPNQPASELFKDPVENDRGKYVSLSWLRKMKTVSGRVKDQLDLENLPE